MKDKRTAEERFFSFIDIPEDKSKCWIWTGSNYLGYGAFEFNGKKRQCTHISWELHNKKPWPKKMHGLHSCDNPPCVNPEHIRPGTPKENAEDCQARSRGHHGTNMQFKTHCRRGHRYRPDEPWKLPILEARKMRCKICSHWEINKNKPQVTNPTPSLEPGKKERLR